ncbi:undecaprenol kinase [Rhodopirellula maiorica SM1]|uniref:Undecaprenol kinase n=1 Tax=Rhodopirellula maiorica SM1 TaxID=1265738 RepID=M5RS92_9BACT|nr:diacylglycerol kinase [Rhodopirellula maiorica]EMI16809.1 undecaprenol kinase [Rhodopirellula maiorica SM1]
MKFAVAFRGLGISLRDQSSLQVHAVAAITVLTLAAYLQFDWWRWAVLVLAITVVIAAELMNTAIERLVRVLHAQRHPEIGDALDTAASAVLVTAIGATVVGVIVLL